MQLILRLIPAACLAVLAAACSGIYSPSQNVMVDFSGTVAPLAAPNVHAFDVGRSNGEYSVKVTALSPSQISPTQSAVLIVALGQVVNGGCGIAQQVFAGLNQLALNSSITKGSYCIAISNPFAANTPDLTYTIHVSHP